MIYVRSFLLLVFFYVWTFFWSVVAMLVLPLPRKWALFPQEFWSRGLQKALPFLVGIRVKYRGLENLPEGGAIVACKHESTWEITVFQGLLKDPAMILKEEIRNIPLFGWYVRKLKMIGVDRSAGPKALRGMLKAAKKAAGEGRKLVIFPEGTRNTNESNAEFQSGVYGLYGTLKLPVVPVALNAATLWPHKSFLRYPGTIYMEFLPPIEPGMGKQEFMDTLAHQIDDTSAKLRELAFVRDSADAP